MTYRTDVLDRQLAKRHLQSLAVGREIGQSLLDSGYLPGRRQTAQRPRIAGRIGLAEPGQELLEGSGDGLGVGSPPRACRAALGECQANEQRGLQVPPQLTPPSLPTCNPRVPRANPRTINVEKARSCSLLPRIAPTGNSVGTLAWLDSHVAPVAGSIDEKQKRLLAGCRQSVVEAPGIGDRHAVDLLDDVTPPQTGF